ncbi:MAG: sulfurtransferase [Pseudomonadales bacterium]
MTANPLIEADELKALLGSPDLRLFDSAVFLHPAKTGYRAESGLATYQQGHIPGAAFMDLIRAFSDTSTGLGFSLPEPAALASAVAAAGIGDNHQVVLYSSGHMMWATRAWWMLRYIGHTNIRVLNGGLAAWQAAGGALETGENSYAAASFSPRVSPNLFVDLKGMEAAGASGACTVNALSRNLYTGEGDFNYGRAGHIPGSLHLHYEDLLREGAFRPVDDLKATLAARGLMNRERLIMYCGGGISATIDAFAAMLAGHPDVAVYDGSMSEWVRSGNPLTTGEVP